MPFPTITADNQTYTTGGITYRSVLAQNRWRRDALTAAPAAGSITTTMLAAQAVTPAQTNLSVTPESTPPGSPAAGTTYLITAPATGAWTGRENQLATWNGTAWTFTLPYTGLVVWDSVAEKLKAWDATPGAWVIVNEYVPPAIADVPANTIRGNLTGAPAPEGNFDAGQFVDWLQAQTAAHDDLKAGILGAGTGIKSEAIDFKVLDRDLTAPPASPATGDAYIVKAIATGAWAGKDGQHARWNGTAWVFTPFTEGMFFWVADENVLLGHDGSAVVQLFPAAAAAAGLVVFAAVTCALTWGHNGSVYNVTINSQTVTGGTLSITGNNTANPQLLMTFATPRAANNYQAIFASQPGHIPFNPSGAAGNPTTTACDLFRSWGGDAGSVSIRCSFVQVGA